MNQDQYRDCIDACNHCADTCDTCASASLKEEQVKQMARCIALDIDCAAMCRLAAAVMARGGEFAEQICKVCADLCDACGEECGRHEMDHCQACAKACRSCAQMCRSMSGPSGTGTRAGASQGSNAH